MKSTPFQVVQALPNYQFRVEFWSVLGLLVLAGILIELVRRRHLKERYSLLWFLTVGVLGALTLWRELLDQLAAALGIYYPPNALFLLLVGFMLLILVHFSTVLSRLLSDRQSLVQKVGQLESRLRELERLSPAGGTSSTSDSGPESR